MGPKGPDSSARAFSQITDHKDLAIIRSIDDFDFTHNYIEVSGQSARLIRLLKG